jgi:hypothetical protein
MNYPGKQDTSKQEPKSEEEAKPLKLKRDYP